MNITNLSSLNFQSSQISNFQTARKKPVKEQKPQITELKAYYTPVFRGIRDRAGAGLRRRSKDELPLQLKKELDNITSTFSTYIHPSVPELITNGTVRDFISDNLSNNRQFINKKVYHVTSEDAANSIVYEGFDFDRYGSIKTGPGVYLTESPVWGQTMCGQGAPVLAATIKGESDGIDSRFFDNITENKDFMAQVKEAIARQGFKISPYEAVVKYVRQIIADDFGLDMLITSIGGARHYVVYNPDSISNIRIDETARNPKNFGIPSDYYRY